MLNKHKLIHHSPRQTKSTSSKIKCEAPQAKADRLNHQRKEKRLGLRRGNELNKNEGFVLKTSLRNKSSAGQIITHSELSLKSVGQILLSHAGVNQSNLPDCSVIEC